mmetsp:Transcript_6030/g.11831  ORF Transcript_6030/g.11831 Transcript_6030/m.11831 type:complete len:103 (-) Transcript_6030:3-311(-)
MKLSWVADFVVVSKAWNLWGKLLLLTELLFLQKEWDGAIQPSVTKEKQTATANVIDLILYFIIIFSSILVKIEYYKGNVIFILNSPCSRNMIIIMSLLAIFK